MANVRLGHAFAEHKDKFISRHGDNSILASAIKRLLHHIGKQDPPCDKQLGTARLLISIGVGRKALLCCNYFISESGELAPFYLYLAEEMVKTGIDNTDMPEVLKAVLEEFGWL